MVNAESRMIKAPRIYRNSSYNEIVIANFYTVKYGNEKKGANDEYYVYGYTGRITVRRVFRLHTSYNNTKIFIRYANQ